MSEHIPQNIDEMLWRTAESADANLRSEFLSSHPSYAQELAAREGVVDAMRAARPVAPIATRFSPAVRPRTVRLWLAPLAAGLLMGLALASYQIVRFNQSAPKRSAPKQEVVIRPPIPQPRGSARRDSMPVPNSAISPGTSERPPVEIADDMVALDPKGATLFAALQAIRAKGVKIQAMPGLEDGPITLESNREDGFIELPAMQMLTAVQKAADFELVDAGPDGYLALPKDRTSRIGAESGTVKLGGN